MVAVGPSYRAVALTFLTGLLVTAADWPVRVAAVAPPVLSAPANGAALARLATTLEWKLPAGATQFQLTLLPSNNDGPGINLIQNAAEQFAVLAPPEWYLLLPGMSYAWRVRATSKTTAVSETDSDWGPWSANWTFRTPNPNPALVHPQSPVLGVTVASRTPTLTWTTQDPALFYFEVHLSTDRNFDTDPTTAVAAVYQNLVHGGVSIPANSYLVPAGAALTPGATYYWRVRPRIQGDGTPVGWEPASSFIVGLMSGGSDISPHPGPLNNVLPLFSRPFKDDVPITNYFDHDLPFQFVDNNGYQVTSWGKHVWKNTDGHNGYDFKMPEGTPIFAAADGTVRRAGIDAPAFCPPLNQTVAGMSVTIQHATGEGNPVIQSGYAHLSRVDVKQGDAVRRGDLIGLSGNAGCSTGPHLHFRTARLVGTRAVLIDPYGWEGSAPDPWAVHPEGAASLWLWHDGAAPPLYKESVLAPNPNPTDNARVAITKVRWAGWRDEDNLNNEWVELSLDPRFAPSGSMNLTGYTLRNQRDESYSFPAGTVILKDRPITVFTGSGTGTPTSLYWGRSTEAWDDMGDCARLISVSGGTYRVRFGGGVCP